MQMTVIDRKTAAFYACRKALQRRPAVTPLHAAARQFQIGLTWLVNALPESCAKFLSRVRKSSTRLLIFKPCTGPFQQK